MNKFLLAELRNLERSIERQLVNIKSEMENDPKSRLLEIELEFQAFLAETRGVNGARTTAQAMARIDDLRRDQERQEERAKLWNHGDLTNDWIQWSGALDDLKRILWNAKEVA